MEYGFQPSGNVDKIAARMQDLWRGVYLVTGQPGIGKTASAEKIADIINSNFPGRVFSYFFSLNHSLRGSTDNFYIEACRTVAGILKTDTDAAAENQRPDDLKADYKYFRAALQRLSRVIGNDDQKRFFIIIDGPDELSAQNREELLKNLPHLNGIIYCIFAQPGICEELLPEDFKDNGKVKNRSEITYMPEQNARNFFWEVYGRDSEEELDDFGLTVSRSPEKWLQKEENRIPLLLKCLAEDARGNGFNPKRAFQSGGLEHYLEQRIETFSPEAKDLLLTMAQAKGTLQECDVREIMGDWDKLAFKKAVAEANRFLKVTGKEISIAHAAFASILKDGETPSYSKRYIRWCSKWSKKGLPADSSAAQYIASNYVSHIAALIQAKPDKVEEAEKLLWGMYGKGEYPVWQAKVFKENGRPLSDISKSIQEAFSAVLPHSDSDLSLLLVLARISNLVQVVRTVNPREELKILIRNGEVDAAIKSANDLNLDKLNCLVYFYDLLQKFGDTVTLPRLLSHA